MRYLLYFFLLLSQVAFAQQKPNIILIVVDDLGWKDLGFMGSNYYETPVLDELATKSIVFRQAYAGAANCAPSRACLLSGLQTPRHGIYTVGSSERGKSSTRKLIPTQNKKVLPDEMLTLAEVLQENGYLTASMGKWHLGESPLSQGFDLNIGGNQLGHPKSYFSPYKNPNLADGPKGEYLTDRLTKEALQFIEQQRDTSFFLYLPYFTIHTPLQGKDSLVQHYKKKGIQDGLGRDPNYGAMVSSMDANIGRILDKLKALKLSNTLLVFTSDNGALAYLSDQAPLRAGKGSYYEGGIRVPLLFHWPDRRWSARQEASPVTNLDLYPTLLELIDIKAPEKKSFDGRSLAGLLDEDKPLEKRALHWHFPVYLQAYQPGQDGSRDALFRTRPGSVIRLGDWKLHEYFEDGGLELYNLRRDPGERKNLANRRKSKTRQLYRLLTEWRSRMNAPVPDQLNPEYDPDQP
ncbi:MAG TPA: sulfatase [Saprospiraceae bacterium]|nr:sulfatase [Saprospiraceae bacterium]